MDLDILAFIDHNITVNVIKDGEIVDKKELVLPKMIKNVIRCMNPRCITSIEQELPHIFLLADEEKELLTLIVVHERPIREIATNWSVSVQAIYKKIKKIKIFLSQV